MAIIEPSKSRSEKHPKSTSDKKKVDLDKTKVDTNSSSSKWIWSQHPKKLMLVISALLSLGYAQYQESQKFYDSPLKLDWNSVKSVWLEKHWWVSIGEIISHNAHLFKDSEEISRLLYNISQWESAIQSDIGLHMVDDIIYYGLGVERGFGVWKPLWKIAGNDGSYGTFQTQRDSFNDLINGLNEFYSSSDPQRMEKQYQNLASIELQDFGSSDKQWKKLYQLAWYANESEFINDIKTNKVYQWVWNGSLWFAFGISQIYLISNYIKDTGADRLKDVDLYGQYIETRKDLEKTNASYKQLSELQYKNISTSRKINLLDEISLDVKEYDLINKSRSRSKSTKLTRQHNTIISKLRTLDFTWNRSISSIKKRISQHKLLLTKEVNDSKHDIDTIEGWDHPMIWIKYDTYIRVFKFFSSKDWNAAQVAPYRSGSVFAVDTSWSVQQLMSIKNISNTDEVVIVDGKIGPWTTAILESMNENQESILSSKDKILWDFLQKTLSYPTLPANEQENIVKNMMTLSYENKIISLACLKKFILDQDSPSPQAIDKIGQLLNQSDDGVASFTKELLTSMSRSSIMQLVGIDSKQYDVFVTSYLLPHLIATTHLKAIQWWLVPQAHNYPWFPEKLLKNNTNTLLRLNKAYAWSFEDLVSAIRKDTMYWN